MLLNKSTIFLCLLGLVYGAEPAPKSNTTSSTIAFALRDCYNDTSIPGILIPKERGSRSWSFFLDLLRELEDGNQGLRDAFYLSADIISLFRQDGIQSTSSSIGLPFTAKHNEKNKVLQFQYMNNNGIGDISMLTKKQKCSLHYFISSTTNGTIRDDESTSCQRSSKYTSRMRREIELVRSVSTSSSSSCPTQSGVVSTPWGAVSMGSVLAGIAAGFRLQNLVYGNSLYANTISGDLANSALLNGLTVSIGSSEGWDNSLNPKILYNSASSGAISDFTLTNAYIRGALDGYYLGTQVSSLKGRYTDIKISQILDMYYSAKGLLNETLSVCNRKTLQTTFMTTEVLTNETRIVLEGLNKQIGVATMEAEDYITTAKTIVDTFNSYLPNLPDVACSTSDLIVERQVVDLYIYLDTKWTYDTASAVINYIVSQVDINKYEGNYTLINGNTGAVLIPSTYKLSLLYEYYNSTEHTSTSQSFDWAASVNHLRTNIKEKQTNKTLGGKALIAMFIVTTKPTDSEVTFINEQKTVISDIYPDLQYIVLGSGSESDYSAILSNPTKQFVTLTELTSNEDNVKESAKNVLNVIADTPRSIVSDCSTKTSTYVYDVERSGVSYLKLHPYYFFNGESDKKLKIKEVNSQDVVQVCIGTASKPDSQTGTCQNLTNEFSYSLDSCSSYSDCSSVYLTVKGVESNSYCKTCRFPDSIQYQITLENTACGSSATKIFVNFVLFVIVLLTFKF